MATHTSLAETIADFVLSASGLSLLVASRVPIAMPSAPRDKAVAEIPPPKKNNLIRSHFHSFRLCPSLLYTFSTLSSSPTLLHISLSLSQSICLYPLPLDSLSLRSPPLSPAIRPRPSANPPAAIIGILTRDASAGISTMLVCFAF